MRVSINKRSLFITVFTIAVICTIFYYRSGSEQGRGIASVSSEQVKLESSRIKLSTIQSIAWEERGSKMSFNLRLPAGFSCAEFTSGKIYLRPEGLSEDGDVSSLEYEVKCAKNEFSAQFENSMKELLASSLTKPDFFEKPDVMVISKIVLEGASGMMSISSYELQSLLGIQLSIKLSE